VHRIDTKLIIAVHVHITWSSRCFCFLSFHSHMLSF